MTMIWSGIFLVAVAILGSLSDAQRPKIKKDQWITSPLAPRDEEACQVDGSVRIQCGLPDISASDCQKIQCCHDGRSCYYGRAVTVQCTKNGQFVVVVAKDATVPNLDLQTISFLGDGSTCGPIDSNSDFLIYQFAVTECGTVVTDVPPGIVVYDNRITSSYETQAGPRGTVTRDSHFDLRFQGRYTGTDTEVIIIHVYPPPAPHSVIVDGPLDMELRLGNGVCSVKGCDESEEAYTSYYTEDNYPITKVLRDPVFVEVRILNRNDPNIVLTVGRCWATSTADPNSDPQWDLLLDGCPYQQDRYRTQLIPLGKGSGLDHPTHYRRFVLYMFTFVDEKTNPLRENVFIHCNAEVWPKVSEDVEPKCSPVPGRKRRDITGTSSRTSRIDSTLVSSGQLIFTDGSQHSHLKLV